MTTIQRPRADVFQAPIVIVGCGCLIAVLTFGPRTTIGLLLPTIGSETGWTRDLFAFAIAIQHLVWGIGQPFGGAVADRVGTVRALSVGALLYAAGLFVIASAGTPSTLFSSGVLLGLGLSGASFNIVLAAFGKLLPDDWRPLATGVGGAAGVTGPIPVLAILCAAAGFLQLAHDAAGVWLSRAAGPAAFAAVVHLTPDQ